MERSPDIFTCPITQDLMIDPVLATDGHTYERRAIEDWLVSHSTSPMTGAELEMKAVFPNHVVRGQIRTWHETQRASHSAFSTPSAPAVPAAPAAQANVLPASKQATPLLLLSQATRAPLLA